ncbi:MAG: sigma-54 dependent transcriptional regulator [Myxococcota bacterium]
MPKSRTWGQDRVCLVAGLTSADQAGCGQALGGVGFSVVTASAGEAAVDALRRQPVAAVVLGAGMPHASATAVLRRAAQCHPPVPVVVVGTTVTVDEAVTMMQAGAADYLAPPLQVEVLLLRLRKLLDHAPEPATRDEVPPELQSYVGLVGSSPAIRSVLATLQRVARYGSNVLLLGESGTGKELVARALHRLGPRRQHLFVPINCATLGRDILENELFGHERGAFTGANERKKGLFELADGGTLFLDEIGEMDPSTQAKLLRVLERNEFRRVGGTEKVKVDLTVVAATNRNLQRAIDAGTFRSDLYYRLKVVTVVVPPLRERREDIPALVDFFIADFNRRHGDKIKGVAPHILKRFMEYGWPGNIRELKNAVESAAVLANGDTLDVDPLVDTAAPGATPAPARAAPPEVAADVREIRLPLDCSIADAEKALIVGAVDRHATLREAANALGIGLRTLHTKLRQYGIAPRRGRRRVAAPAA